MAPTRLSSVPAEYHQAHILVNSGIFDAELYAVSRPSVDPTPFGCALNFLREGARQGFPLHPLIEAVYLPAPVRDQLFAGVADAVLAHLQSDAALQHAWGPLFDPRNLGQGTSAFEAFMALSGEDVLPVIPGYPDAAPTLDRARSNAIDHARMVARQRDYRLAPIRTDWDETLERDWVDSARALPLPERTDGAPLVSIVMPVWNREAQLLEAVESVLTQTFPDWELIIVDDGSDDGTYAAACDAAARDRRIIAIQVPHGGVCAARNAGLDAARGTYLAFLDSDNNWDPAFLDLACRALADTDAVGVYSALQIVDIDGAIRFRGGQVGFDDLLIENAIDMNCLLTRRAIVEQIGGFDVQLRRWVDYDLVLRLAKLGSFEYLPFRGCYYSNTLAVDRITVKEPLTWRFRVAEKAFIDWPKVEGAVAERAPDRTSVIIAVHENGHRTALLLEDILRTTGDRDIEVIVVDNGAALVAGRLIASQFADHPRVKYHRLARNYGHALAANVGYALSTGSTIVFLDGHSEVRSGWLEPLLEALGSDDAPIAAQPTITGADGTVVTAGYLYSVDQHRPSHFLANHPLQDAERAPSAIAAVTGIAFAIRADLFAEHRGFDALFRGELAAVDLCLRAQQAAPERGFVRARSTVVLHDNPRRADRVSRFENDDRQVFSRRWHGLLPAPDLSAYEAIGLSVVGTSPDVKGESGAAKPIVTRPTTSVIDPVHGEIPSLRWAIKIGAEYTRGGDGWGDVPFADDLALALRARGQDVVIDRHGAFGRSTAYLDDVVLTVRGKQPAQPHAGRINILWVISRPELVTIAEVQGFDRVFAASPLWAEWMQRRSGKRIEVLLQATHPDRFSPTGENIDAEIDLLFVGGPRIHEGGRQVVTDALSAGADLALWGPGWSKVAPAEMVRGEFLPFEQLSSAYRRASLVLNDHMPTMAEWGFVNNRTFDVIATGTPVLSDHVEGLDLFEGAVVSYQTTDELAALLADRDWIPSPEKMQEIAERIRREHSFEARAEVLLATVLGEYKLKSPQC
ncbi:glycosyltransferase [Agromyces salentinus]|uniref:Glycosyltransferase n=1 Tax=Agromyces salentinus TaxID=269421 RepID=A0ABP4Z7N2_9MICO|nr:glycosyltransferase [Agromyces salentinus]